MKTVSIEGKTESISYKTDTGMYTRYQHPDIDRPAQYGADIYTVDSDEDLIVLVGTAHIGGTLSETRTIINYTEYSELAAQHDPYNDIHFHRAVMERLGFTTC